MNTTEITTGQVNMQPNNELHQTVDNFQGQKLELYDHQALDLIAKAFSNMFAAQSKKEN